MDHNIPRTTSQEVMAATTLSSVAGTVNQTAGEMFLSKHVFSWYDYILFTAMLVVSALIGIYFGFCGKKQSTSKEYLMGGKEMKVIPIAISLVASHTSGLTLMAIPADVYMFGAAYVLGIVSMAVLSFITVYVFLPVFFDLPITSTYEYLGLRFDDRVRKCASGLFALSVFVYLPMVVYIPSLAFEAVTGVSVFITTPVICGVCIFYTTIGGLKAVVWTDAIQFTITVGSLIVVFILGLVAIGGFEPLWNASLESSRLHIFDFDPDPTKRETFWAIIIGLTVHWVAHTSINQGCTQKFLAVATYKESVRAVFYYAFGMSVMKLICVTLGLIMAVMYSHCDPIITHQIDKKDQLVPYYVMNVASHIPGLSGLFIAGIFSAALSTMSANLNSLAGTIYEDFLKTWLENHHNRSTAGHILKLIVVTVGVTTTLLVFVVQHLGGLFGLAIALGSVAHGPLLALFSLGVLFPRANSKGAFWGALTSMVFMGVIIAGQRYHALQGGLGYDKKPMTIDQCDFYTNATVAVNSASLPVHEPIFVLFRISFYWYTMTGAIVGIVVGLVISYLTNKDDPPVERHLVSPVVRFLLPKDIKKTAQVNGRADYHTIEKAMELVTVEQNGADNR
ncbi:sodium-coupled monocarboxylate transporter 2-like [Cylas formicarius]|uniref:sodium-coupled monocarboxylate transporter 2-like n=1 Tax=Cylas formicarius TaxID=197179 RepID=UPI002958A00B|nr:sodium-coupled monocarboxylate transporter 2-like [Cylas formicarius]